MSVILFSNCVMLPVNYNICYNIAVSQHGNSMQKTKSEYRIKLIVFHSCCAPEMMSKLIKLVTITN